MRYKFRAECTIDVFSFLGVIGDQFTDLQITRVMLNGRPLPDVEVSITTDLLWEDLVSAMRQVEDGHVMAETVTLAALYTGERRGWERVD